MHLKHSTALNEHSDEIDHLTKNNDHMDSFLTQIYTVILQIPKGKVATYGDIAKMAGYPGYARQVGKALSNLPESSAGHTDGFLFGLAPSGVYHATNCYQLRGALLPHPFTLTCALS